MYANQPVQRSGAVRLFAGRALLLPNPFKSAILA